MQSLRPLRLAFIFAFMDTDDVHDEISARPSLEAQLAAITEQLLTDQIAASDAIGSLEAVYQAVAEQLRCA